MAGYCYCCGSALGSSAGCLRCTGGTYCSCGTKLACSCGRRLVNHSDCSNRWTTGSGTDYTRER